MVFLSPFNMVPSSFMKKIKNGVDYDKKIAANLINKSSPLILKLKKHFNRPRPKQLAKTMNIKIKDIEILGY